MPKSLQHFEFTQFSPAPAQCWNCSDNCPRSTIVGTTLVAFFLRLCHASAETAAPPITFPSLEGRSLPSLRPLIPGSGATGGILGNGTGTTGGSVGNGTTGGTSSTVRAVRAVDTGWSRFCCMSGAAVPPSDFDEDVDFMNAATVATATAALMRAATATGLQRDCRLIGGFSGRRRRATAPSSASASEQAVSSMTAMGYAE
mmetsp:Transcript_115100/g.245939  ORF Transcript_115100/g.245939 Transcript_115100/m.245939 type:complete len:201 (-) Transcript_115100:80-682(-)